MNIPGAQQGQRTANAGLTPRAGVAFVTSSALVTEYEMTTDIRSVELTTDNANALTLYLPPVALAGGMIFFLYLVKDDGVDVTVKDFGDVDEPDFTHITMDTVNDAFVLISDGIHWFATNGSDTS